MTRTALHRPASFLWRSRARSRPHAQPAGEEEPAHLRVLCRAARPVPGAARRRGRAAVVINGAGGNFCSGGDVHEIIGPLTRGRCRAARVHAHDRRPGPRDARLPAADRRRDRRHMRRRRRMLAPWPRTSASRRRGRTAFLFVRVGLAGCDMGACALLPRLIGQGRAAELLYTGRSMRPRKASAGASSTGWCRPSGCWPRPQTLAAELAAGPTLAHAMTKRMLHQEWTMGIDEALDAEARGPGRAACRRGIFTAPTRPSRRSSKPAFEGD